MRLLLNSKKKVSKMKLVSLKVFNSIKVGTGEFMFMTDKDFEIELVDNLIFIKCRKEGAESITSLSNVPWFTRAVQQVDQVNEQDSGNKDTPRVKQKKAK